MPKISALQEAASLESSDLLVVVQGGINKKITFKNMESSMSPPLTTLYDEIDASTTYVGKAPPGSSTASPVWQVFRLATTAPDFSLQYAGSGNFSQIWDNRASLTYTN